ncbi:hypothetical protein Tco_0384268, partial [Tanacetum coccineum]
GSLGVDGAPRAIPQRERDGKNRGLQWPRLPPPAPFLTPFNKTQFDLRPLHMESDRWPQIYAGIQQHLQKIYNGKKAALKERYWVLVCA